MKPKNMAREAEFIKYERAYSQTGRQYRMKPARRLDVEHAMSLLDYRGSFLDVGCGRRDLMDAALGLGFSTVRGTEVVRDLIDGKYVVFATADSLPFPDKSFDVVAMTDVIEHLIPGDDALAIKELCRVSRRSVFITANNAPSYNKDGDDLHINKRPYSEWQDMLQWHSPQGSIVTRLLTIHQDEHRRRNQPKFRVSPLWRIDLP